MKKVAIATMTSGANYGNVLQNYAVLKLIEKCGYAVETLNITTKNGYPDEIPNSIPVLKKIHPDYLLSWYQSKLFQQCGAKNDDDFRPTSLKRLRKNTNKWKEAVKLKQDIFVSFKKELLNYTEFEINNRNFNLAKMKQYAAVVSGSDQVWNPYYRTNSMVEFLQMVPKEKRIAFIPSFGVSQIPKCREVEYAQWLGEIPFLSVRENEGAEIIKKLAHRDAQVLLDPTFGLSKQEWTAFSQQPFDFDLRPGSFVFCYFLGNRTREYTKYIFKYAKKHNCSVVDVYDVAQLNNYTFSPQEFVWLLNNSKAVFTDSFHGCAFSLNLNKPFVVFDRCGDGCITQSSRITTLLGKLQMEDRKYELLQGDNIDHIQFEDAIRIIESEREDMFAFLRNALEKTTDSLNSIMLATKRHCTGCGACKNACSNEAISMKPDDEGFLYPIIDLDKCIHCHMCERVCPADCTEPSLEETKAYYAFSKNAAICRASSSGGVFTEIAEMVLKQGGIIFGAGYDKNFEVCHTSAENVEQLKNLCMSKYVQSNTQNVFRNVRKQLASGRKVMFSGTPCQCAALKTYLNKDYSNLLLVDIICHGVPSPKIWRDYLVQEHGDNKKITSISFRNKDKGWNNFSMKIEYEDGSFYRELAVKDPYESAFLANLSLRPSCYQCQYKTIERISDLTIADYWGVEEVHPELNNQEGVSLVLTHSMKGAYSLYSLKNVVLAETDMNRAVAMNHAATHSVSWPVNRNKFFEIESKVGVKKASMICLRLSSKQKFRRIVIRNGARIKGVLRKSGVLR